MPDITQAKIAILATDGFEKSELCEPMKQLDDLGADVTIVSIEAGEIRSWDKDDWGDSIAVHKTVEEVSVEDFDALVLPGGQINPDVLRTNEDAVEFVRAFFYSGKTLAAICHAPWLLIEAGVVEGRTVTSYNSIKTDVINAGGNWVDEPVAVDDGLITSRNPDDLDAFISKIVEEIEEGRHERAAA